MKQLINVYDNVYIDMQKAAPHKYIRKIPKSGGGYNYIYKEDFKNPFMALLSIFFFKKDKIDKEYKQNNIKEKYQIDEKVFASHVLEYLSNRKKWDGVFGSSKGNKKSISSHSKEKEKSKNIKVVSDSKMSFNKNLMKEIYTIFNKKEISNEHERPREQPIVVSTNNVGASIKEFTIKTAREDITRKPTKDFLSENFRGTLRDFQKDFVNLTMENFIDKKEKAMFNMDGTGAGKTFEELGLAQSYLDKNPNKPVLIITENKRIVDSSFLPDAEKVKTDVFPVQNGSEIKSNGIYITTYNRLKEFQNNNFGLVIFDESHNLKNKSIKTEQGEQIIEKADNVGLFSATPLDKGNQIGYIAKAFQLSKTKLMKALGYELENQWTGRETIKVWKAQIEPEEIANRIDGLFTDLTKNGLAIKREVPLENLETRISKIDLTEEQQSKYQQAESNFLRQIANNPKTKATGLMSLRRFTEELKIDSVINNIKNEIDTNNKKQIVLFATRVNDSDVFDEESLGTLKEISKRLTEQGIDHANVFASSKKAKEDIQNFQDGKVKIILTTPQSGGTGLSLDDTFGDRPRKAIVVTPPFSAMDFIQMAGRINRLNTKSKAEIEMFSTDTMVDGWNKDIIANKLLTLGSAVSGDYKKLDIRELDRLQYMSAEDQREYMGKKNIDQKVAYKEERNISINDFKLNSNKSENLTDAPKIPQYPIRNIDSYKTFIPKSIEEEWPDAEIGFGKYKGKTLSELQESDASYMRWMFSNISRDAEKKVGSIKFMKSLQKAVLLKKNGKYYIKLQKASLKLEEQIIDFFKKNPSPKDEKFHAFMDRMKIEHSIGEGEVYKILSSVLSGGKSKGKTTKVDPHELEMGIKVEAEHTNDKLIAEKIARDHLTEFSNYYTELAKMEKKLSKAANRDKVDIVMNEFKRGKLKSSDGKIVTDRKQAIAIAMSESGQSKMIEDEEIEDEKLEKAKAVPVGTVSGKYKKVANGKWVKVSEKKDGKKEKEPEKKDKKDKDQGTESSPKKELIKNALKKIAGIFSEILSGRDPNQPTGQAVEDTGERLKTNKKWKSKPKEKEQKE